MTQVIVQRTGEATGREFSNLPAASPALIELLPAPTPAADTAARELADALARALGAVPDVAERAVPYVAPDGPSVHPEPGWRKLLVLVADQAAPPIPTPLDPLVATWLTGGASYVIFPLLQEGTVAETYLSVEELRRLNASFWTATSAEDVDEVLALALLADADRRVFVSYRRGDTLEIAEQLFEALEKHRFDVFVDRFSVPKAVNFQEWLFDELAHRSMVVVLESPDLLGSAWVRDEIDFAKTHKLGHLAVHLPGGTRVQWLEDPYRVSVAADELVPPPPPDRPAVTKEHRLTEAALARVIAAIVAEHSNALLKRRGRLLSELSNALAKHPNVSQKLDLAGHLHATATRPAAGTPWAAPVRSTREYLVWTAPRPPEVDDFRTAHALCTPGPDPPGVIVTQKLFQAQRRQARMAWLAERSLVCLYET
ncbi:MAG TPA: toll/interleukin-1 receptor domain-containing protein, partial [Longimicrobiaceae bacterium]|nr:toll/interleukin-1 receptor domain-containing protein [Longimicrobiaceae bacterium]